jgi:hypothetical protein
MTSAGSCPIGTANFPPTMTATRRHLQLRGRLGLEKQSVEKVHRANIDMSFSAP